MRRAHESRQQDRHDTLQRTTCSSRAAVPAAQEDSVARNIGRACARSIDNFVDVVENLLRAGGGGEAFAKYLVSRHAELLSLGQ
jgi:hypothetical protein